MKPVQGKPCSAGRMRSEVKSKGKLHTEVGVLSTLKLAVNKPIPSGGVEPKAKPVEKLYSEGGCARK